MECCCFYVMGEKVTQSIQKIKLWFNAAEAAL